MRRIDYGNGAIVYDEFKIDFSKPYSEQTDNLQEDLIQVKYNGNLLLDVGWYPEFDPTGHFVVVLVENTNWAVPFYHEKSRSEKALLDSIEKAAEIANSMGKISKAPFV